MLAHELSHIAHRDVAVMTIASFLGVLAGFMARRASLWTRGAAPTQRARSSMLRHLGRGVVVYAISFLLIRALSRYREFAADRAGAYLTGQPSALASALVKLSSGMAAIPDKDIRKSEAMNAFVFTPAFKTAADARASRRCSPRTPARRSDSSSSARIANDLGKPF